MVTDVTAINAQEVRHEGNPTLWKPIVCFLSLAAMKGVVMQNFPGSPHFSSAGSQIGKFDMHGGLIPHALLCYPRSQAIRTFAKVVLTGLHICLYCMQSCMLICAFSIQIGMLSALFSSLLENPPHSFQTFQSGLALPFHFLYNFVILYMFSCWSLG